MLKRTLAGLALVLAVTAFNSSPASAFGWCGGGGVTGRPTHLGPTRMRPELTTAQERGSIVLRTTVGPTIGQAYGCTGEHITVGPSLGGPIGRRLLGASTVGRSCVRTTRSGLLSIGSPASLAQEIARGSGGASRSETPLIGSPCHSRVHRAPVLPSLGSKRWPRSNSPDRGLEQRSGDWWKGPEPRALTVVLPFHQARLRSTAARSTTAAVASSSGAIS